MPLGTRCLQGPHSHEIVGIQPRRDSRPPRRVRRSPSRHTAAPAGPSSTGACRCAGARHDNRPSDSQDHGWGGGRRQCLPHASPSHASHLRAGRIWSISGDGSLLAPEGERARYVHPAGVCWPPHSKASCLSCLIAVPLCHPACDHRAAGHAGERTPTRQPSWHARRHGC